LAAPILKSKKNLIKMKEYKASTNFSFGGRAYVEGQEVKIDDEDIIAKLEERGQISAGKGTPLADIEAENDEETLRKRQEADKKRAQEAYDREVELIDRQTKPRESVKMMVDDQTGYGQEQRLSTHGAAKSAEAKQTATERQAAKKQAQQTRKSAPKKSRS
jgi:hypothetical protein